MIENIKKNKKEKEEITIKSCLSEIDNKKYFLNSFKKRYLNNIKNENISLKIKTLNNLINEFEKTISLVLEILLSYQEELQSNNKIPIKIKNTKANNNKKRNISKDNYNYSLNDKKDNSYFKNNSTIPKNSKRIIIKNNSIEANKENSSNNKNNLNFNNTIKNNNSYSLKKIRLNETNSIQNVKMPYHLFLKNQLSYINDKKNNNNSLFPYNTNSYSKKFPSLKEKTLRTLYNTENMNNSKNKNETSNFNNYNTNNENSKEKNNINSLEVVNRSNSEKNFNKIKAKTPIRRSLRALLKEKKISNNSCNQMRNKFNDINYNTIDDDDLIKKINESEKYKSYFSNKYGEGNYFNFINKYKKNLLNYNLIKNEFNLISRVIELNEKKENNIYYKKNSLSISKENILNGTENYNNKYKTPIGIRKRILIQKNKNNSKINAKDIKKKKNEINNKDIKRLNKFRIPKSNRFNNIEDLINNYK